MKKLWYKKDLAQVCSELGVDVTVGLTQRSAESRVKTHGKNKIPILKKQRSKILRNFVSASILLLSLLAVVFAFIGLPTPESVLFLCIYLMFGGFVSFLVYLFYQNRNELKSLLKRRASVLRGGMQLSLFAEELVPGDLILLKKGDVVPADAYLIKSFNLTVLEGTITDNYAITPKQAGVIKRDVFGPSEMSNLLFATSVIASGEATAIVIATGRDVTVVDVAAKRTVKEKSFFLKTLTDFSVVPCFLSAVFALLSFCFVFAYSAYGQMSHAATVSLALLSSSLSFLLPHVCELSLLIRNRSHGDSYFRIKDAGKLEDLSALDLLVVPSSAFLSDRELEVGALFTANEKASYEGFLENPTKDLQTLTLIAHAAEDFTRDDALLNNEQLFVRRYRRAILDFAKEKYTGSKNAYTHKTYRLADVGFRFDTSLVTVGDSNFAVIKGNYRAILSGSTHFLQGGRYRPLDATVTQELSRLAERFEAMGFEVIAYARSAAECKDLNNPIGLHSQMHLLGMFALRRKRYLDNSDFFADCKALGVRPVILHNGSKNTFIANFKDADFFADLRICDGHNFADDQASVAQNADAYDVFCALSEKQRHNLVKAYRRAGYCTGVMETDFSDYYMSAGADIVFAAKGSDTCDAITDTAHVVSAPKAKNLTETLKTALQTMRSSVNAAKYLFLSVLLRAALVLFGAVMKVDVLTPVSVLFIGLVLDTAALAVILFERFYIKKGKSFDRNAFVNQFSVVISLLLPFFTLIFAMLPVLILYAAGRPLNPDELQAYAFLAFFLISYLATLFYAKRRFGFAALIYTVGLLVFLIFITLISGFGALFGFTASPLVFLALIPVAVFFELTRLLPFLIAKIASASNQSEKS